MEREVDKMQYQLPGTLMEMGEEFLDHPFDAIAPLLSATGGLTLAQVSELTGLEPTTIQNWVKRGWVARAEGKRYGERQLMRIILMNLLRGGLRLDAIAGLMTYINGDVEDASDDIIPDRELYSRLCRVIWRAEAEYYCSGHALRSLVEEELCNYRGPSEAAEEKLLGALEIMALVYLSTQMRDLALREYAKLDLGC